MSDITNGRGGVVAITDSPQQINLVTEAEDNRHKTAMTCKITNTGSSTVYACANETLDTFDIAKVVPIAPDGGSFWFVGQPIKRIILACDSEESSTANYGAY